MDAIIIHENSFHFRQIPDKHPGNGQVKIKLKTAGLNHRDLFLMKNHETGNREFILGSDGAGIVTEIGHGVRSHLLHAEVIINPVLNWKTVEDVPAVPDILGGPSDGTFSPYVIVPAENAIVKPDHLTWEEAGVLPLSALTAYRALFTKGQLKKGEHLILPGIGSGVATYALRTPYEWQKQSERQSASPPAAKTKNKPHCHTVQTGQLTVTATGMKR